MIIHHRKNSTFELVLPMVEAAAPENFKTGETVTDTAFSKDGAGAWTSLAITDTFSEIGTTGMYEISLTASEMNHDYVVLKATSTLGSDTFVWFRMFTGDIDQIGGLNAAAKADVNAEVDAALIEIGLDHLVSAAVVGADVTDNSVFASIVSKSGTADWDDFVNTTDSLQALSEDGVNLNAAGKLSSKAEAVTALSDIHLDHLLATDTPAPLPGVTGAILNDLLEDDGGTWRFIANALEEGTHAVVGTLRVLNTTVFTGSTTTAIIVPTGVLPSGVADDDYNDMQIVIRDISAGSRIATRRVQDFTASTRTFTLDSALPFTPVNGDGMEVWVENVDEIALLNRLATGFSTTSPDNLQSYLKAMMSKGASDPADVGTYSASTDSLEKAAEQLIDIQGAGFATGTDSLKAIRDAIDTLVAPSIVGSSALSGSGFLSDCVSLIRKAVDEPSIFPKYTDGDILELLQAAYDVIISDININTDHPILVRLNINIVDGKQSYTLPPHCAEVWRIAKINDTTNTPEWEVWPGGYFNFSGPGFGLEGNTIRLLRDWNDTETLEVLYVPNGETAIHKATATAVSVNTITFPASVTDGTLDTREQAYAGYMLRILSDTSGIVQERIIIAYDNDTRIATLIEDFAPTPSGTIVYEVIPQYSRLLKHVLCLRTSLDILAQQGNVQRTRTLERTYQVKLSALRRYQSSKQSRFPNHLDGDTSDNLNRGGFGQGMI